MSRLLEQNEALAHASRRIGSKEYWVLVVTGGDGSNAAVSRIEDAFYADHPEDFEVLVIPAPAPAVVVGVYFAKKCRMSPAQLGAALAVDHIDGRDMIAISAEAGDYLVALVKQVERYRAASN